MKPMKNNNNSYFTFLNKLIMKRNKLTYLIAAFAFLLFNTSAIAQDDLYYNPDTDGNGYYSDDYADYSDDDSSNDRYDYDDSVFEGSEDNYEYFDDYQLIIDELNSTVVIDKEELGLKEFSPEKVTLEQIPDLAKMKSFIVWFH